MRYLTAMLTTAALLLALAAPAGAATVNRQIATECFQGHLYGTRYNPTASIQTAITCPTWTFFQNGKYVTWSRPVTDLEAADRTASHFWPGCTHEWYGVNDQRAQTGVYYTFFHITC